MAEIDADTRRALADAIAAARDRWPQLRLDATDFVADVVARVPAEEPLREAIDRMHLVDLWLATACVRGIDGAAASFTALYADDVRRGVTPGGEDAGRIDDLQQDVMQRLLVARDGEAPRLAGYSGHGPLGRWVSVVARRHCLDAMRRRGDPAEARTDNDALSAAYGDPELALMTGDQRDAFREALRRGAESLSARERLLLRYHYVHALRLDEIAGIYRVSRTTVGRRLADARKQLVRNAREALRDLLGLAETDLDREIASLRSAIDVTLRRILKD